MKLLICNMRGSIGSGKIYRCKEREEDVHKEEIPAYVQLDSLTSTFIFALTCISRTDSLWIRTYVYATQPFRSVLERVERRDRNPHAYPSPSYQSTLRNTSTRVPSLAKKKNTTVLDRGATAAAAVNPRGNFAVLSRRRTRQVVRGALRGILPSSSRWFPWPTPLRRG